MTLVSILVLEFRDQDFSWDLETKTWATWSWDQDLSPLVSRPRPRPSGLKSKTLAFRSRVNSSLRPYRSRDHKSAFCLKFTIRSNSPTFQTEFHGNSRREVRVTWIPDYRAWRHFGFSVAGLGAFHLWRPHGGEGVRLRWTHVDGGGVQLYVDASTQKIKIRAHWHHPVFFSCKEFAVFFSRISSLDGVKIGIFRRYQLVI